MNYEKLGETEIIINTLPQKQQTEEEVWTTTLHEFTLNTESAQNGRFKLFVSPSLTSIPPLGVSALIMKDMKENNRKEEIKLSDTYLRYITLDTYLIDEPGRENFELLHEIVVSSINNFNSFLDKHPTTFRLGRFYEIPPKEQIINDIKQKLTSGS